MLGNVTPKLVKYYLFIYLAPLKCKSEAVPHTYALTFSGVSASYGPSRPASNSFPGVNGQLGFFTSGLYSQLLLQTLQDFMYQIFSSVLLWFCIYR